MLFRFQFSLAAFYNLNCNNSKEKLSELAKIYSLNKFLLKPWILIHHPTLKFMDGQLYVTPVVRYPLWDIPPYHI